MVTEPGSELTSMKPYGLPTTVPSNHHLSPTSLHSQA